MPPEVVHTSLTAVHRPLPANAEAREAAAGAMSERTDEDDTLPELR